MITCLSRKYNFPYIVALEINNNLSYHPCHMIIDSSCMNINGSIYKSLIIDVFACKDQRANLQIIDK